MLIFIHSLTLVVYAMVLALVISCLSHETGFPTGKYVQESLNGYPGPQSTPHARHGARVGQSGS